MNTFNIPKQHERKREDINAQIEAFFRQGGEINHLESCVRNTDTKNTCEQCGNEYERKPTERTRTFCSQDCYKKAQKIKGFV